MKLNKKTWKQVKDCKDKDGDAMFYVDGGIKYAIYCTKSNGERDYVKIEKTDAKDFEDNYEASSTKSNQINK